MTPTNDQPRRGILSRMVSALGRVVFGMAEAMKDRAVAQVQQSNGPRWSQLSWQPPVGAYFRRSPAKRAQHRARTRGGR
jgi:hypothetical protein